MACVAVTSLVRTLELEFLLPQPRPIVLQNELISGNKELIESLREKLQLLMEQLDEKRMDGVEAIKDLEAKLRDVAFRVEDEIEFQVADLYAEKVHHCLRLAQICGLHVEKIQPCLRLHHILQQTIQDIDHIQEELVKVKNQYDLVIQDLQGTKTTAVGVLPKPDDVMMMGDSSQHAPHLDGIMVGKNDEFKTIMELLIEHPSKQREIISIKGMGGIGKTTLARRAYEDPLTASHFDKRAWIVSSQHHDRRQMLVGLLNSMGNEETGSDEELELRIYQCLKRRRYLIVIDDVWSGEAWDAVNTCFPDDRNGSRVLLTTRLAKVANYTYSGSDFSHQVHTLDQSESWNLFCEKACKTHYPGFETIGRPIVEKCKGLPLAIVVVAGIFSKLNTLNEWENIAEALNSSETTTIAESCSRILSLSYHHLPYNLKACFLYLGVFPEDEEIYTNSLARLWAAEGLVKTIENETFEVVAQRHIQELVDRNQILVCKQSSGGRKIKSFRIHDLLHAFCVREAQNENLLTIVSKNSSNFHHKNSRWVSIQSSRFDVRTFCASPQKSSRSIFCFLKFARPYLYLQNFKLLRVLYSSDMKQPQAHEFCRIVHPIHLRYLSSSDFISNPFSTWNLQTLYDGAFPLLYSLDFPQLCHYYRYSITWPDCPIFVHQNLQSFSGLSLSCCTKKFFTNTPCLKKVGVVKTDESVVDCISCIGSLAYLQQLESLKVSVTVIGGLFKYPINNQIALLKNIKKLSFLHTGFRWEEISVLSTLPRLEVLKLGSYACKGQSWRLREEDIFCRLIFLKLGGVVLRHWEASGDHFPKLESLFIYQCDLQEIPNTFADISTLKSIELMGCLPSTMTSAKQIQEEQHNQGNYNMVVIQNDRIWTTPSSFSTKRMQHR